MRSNLIGHYDKKAFSLLELIFAIILIAVISSFFIPKNNFNKLNFAADKIVEYLKYTRYIAMIDNKYKIDDPMWYKERWTFKFQHCSEDTGGLYYIIFTDTNHKGSANKSECLKDPLTNKYLYSNYDCQASSDESKYILLTKEYGVTDVKISCNETSTIGQISFGHDGKIYARLGTQDDEIEKYEILEKCFIELYDKKHNVASIILEPKTGYIYRQKEE